jgi:hypothetical protein
MARLFIQVNAAEDSGFRKEFGSQLKRLLIRVEPGLGTDRRLGSFQV